MHSKIPMSSLLAALLTTSLAAVACGHYSHGPKSGPEEPGEDRPPADGAYPGGPPPAKEPPGDRPCSGEPYPEKPCPAERRSADLRQACPSWRWVGIQSDADELCPAIPGWSSRHLFCPPESPAAGTATPAAAKVECDPRLVPPALRPFCLFEHPAEGADLVEAGIAGLDALGRDCMVVAPAGSAVARALLGPLEEHFLTQAGRRPADRLPAPGGSPVRLAVVDTHPTDAADPEARPANSSHGASLVSMARRLLAAEGGGEAARVTSRLALAWVTVNPWSRLGSVRDTVRGGFVGSRTELAEALRDEVVAAAAAGDQRLVLNLSVAWPRGAGGLEAAVADMPVDAQAVFRALENARDEGAVVLAAAGNRSWGAEREGYEGLLLPAAWQDRGLLEAVGGVDAEARPLADARLGAEPAHTAFADHAVVARAADGEPTAVLTGSSVASLVAAAAAAASWTYGPEREAAEVLEGLGGGRVLLCPAAHAACQTPAERCPACGGEDSYLRHRLEVAGERLFELFEGVERLEPPAGASEALQPACPPGEVAALLQVAGEEGGAERRRGGTPGEPLPCPHFQLPGVQAEAWVGPQPQSDPCPTCSYDPDSGFAYVEVSDAMLGRMTAATLKAGETTWDLGLDLALAGDEPPRLVVPGIEAAPGEPVRFSVAIDGSHSATSVLLRLP